MKILFINDYSNDCHIQQNLTQLALRNGWKLTEIKPRPHLKVVIAVGAFLALIILAILILVQHYMLIVVIALLFYRALRRMYYILQVKGGIKAATFISRYRRPNFIIATGMVCAVALEEQTLRKLPVLMINPRILKYKEQCIAEEKIRLLTLRDTAFTSVTYDSADNTQKIHESMLLAETAQPGTIITERLKLNTSFTSKLESLINDSFVKGWQHIMEVEQVTIITENGALRIRKNWTPDKQTNRFFFKDSDIATYSPWLTQSDLCLIASYNVNATQ